jgi:hypothetical protein
VVLVPVVAVEQEQDAAVVLVQTTSPAFVQAEVAALALVAAVAPELDEEVVLGKN